MPVAATIGEILVGIDADTLIHLTPEREAAFDAGVDAGTYFARLSDVAGMTVTEYQALVVGGAAAAGPGQAVLGFVVVTPGIGSFAPVGSFNLAGVLEYVNTQSFHHSGYFPLP